eukprot:Tamp_33880.p2 GENE.Tamp_33880~~Tamp_33880.p2  ORF type:complete len:124 (-),score=7.18 Tamp_33880:156-527(-)
MMGGGKCTDAGFLSINYTLAKLTKTFAYIEYVCLSVCPSVSLSVCLSHRVCMHADHIKHVCMFMTPSNPVPSVSCPKPETRKRFQFHSLVFMLGSRSCGDASAYMGYTTCVTHGNQWRNGLVI